MITAQSGCVERAVSWCADCPVCIRAEHSSQQVCHMHTPPHHHAQHAHTHGAQQGSQLQAPTHLSKGFRLSTATAADSASAGLNVVQLS